MNMHPQRSDSRVLNLSLSTARADLASRLNRRPRQFLGSSLATRQVSTNSDLFDGDDHGEPRTSNAKHLNRDRRCAQRQGAQGHRQNDYPGSRARSERLSTTRPAVAVKNRVRPIPTAVAIRVTV